MEALCPGGEVVTDHQALVCLMGHSLLRGELVWWVWEIQPISFTRTHSPGEDLFVADALSRDIFKPSSFPYCQELLKAIGEAPGLPEKGEFWSPTDAVEIELAEDDSESNGGSKNAEVLVRFRA